MLILITSIKNDTDTCHRQNLPELGFMVLLVGYLNNHHYNYVPY